MTTKREPWFQERERPQADRAWMAQALCAQTDEPVETFYGRAWRARTICAECPVAWQCRNYAYVTEERHGIWGGINFGDWNHGDPRLREAYVRAWNRAPEGSEERKRLRKFSRLERELLAALEDLI